MAKRYRQRSWISTGYWSVSMAGLLVLTAYQFEWPPFSGDRYAAVTPESSLPGPGEVGAERDLANSLEVDERAFESQLEPPPNDRLANDRQAMQGSVMQVGHQHTEPQQGPATFRSQEFNENGLHKPQQFIDPPEARKLTGTTPPKIDRNLMTSQFEQFSDEKRTASTPTSIGEGGSQATAGEFRTADGVTQTTSRTPADSGDDFPFEGSGTNSSEFDQFPEQQSADVDPQLQAIDALISNSKYIDAHRALSKIYWKEPARRADIEGRIEETARVIYFSPQPHFMKPYVIEAGDRLAHVSKLYRVPWEYLEALNQIDARRIREGQKLKVIKGPFSAIVDVKNFEMTVHSHGYYVRKYKIGVGKDNSTPVGKFAVLNKVANPQYTDPDGRVVAGDDPQNPLGEYWIDLGESYGIHGTIDPASIGQAESAGCIRMADRDITEVYNLLTVGSEVIIRP